MRLQLRAIILAVLFFAVSAGSASAQTERTASRWITSNLPHGVTIQSSTPAQLAAAVTAAIRAHPKQAKAIVAYVFSQLTDGDKDKALALIDAIIAVVPADEVADLIKIAIGSLAAVIDPQTGQSAQSALTAAITKEAIADDPALASVILAAIGAGPPGPGAQLQGPGNVTNPANLSNTNSTVSHWIISNLPQGVTIQSSTPAQLAAAVTAAIRAHPKQAKAIVAYVFSQLTDGDKDKALALINAIISVVPADEVADLIKIAIGSLSAVIDPQTGQSAQSALTAAITQQAIADDPALASLILAAIGASAPGPGTQFPFQGPGNVTNPANFSNTTGPVTSPQ